jgi:hypothetical protein
MIAFAAMEAAAKHLDEQDAAASTPTVAALRARGPEGLDVALELYDRLAQQAAQLEEQIIRLETAGGKLAHGKGTKSAPVVTRMADAQRELATVRSQLENWRDSIDHIGGQRTCTVSRLYWYTDIDEAKAEARRTGRPILSLRMLGKLTEEFSCANSRFFRTALYSNQELSRYLRDHYVLHWESVRPVPRVTIDFGDGRKLERTLTGNSAHFVFTGDGQPLDVLPGLYSPKAFGVWLKRMHKFHREYAVTAAHERGVKLADFHRQRRALVYQHWAADIRRLGESQTALVSSRIDRAIESAAKSQENTPLAVAASRLAVAKTAAEAPLLRLAHFAGPWIDAGMDQDLWRKIANLHRDGVKLDEASVSVVRGEFPNAAAAGELAFTKSRQEDPVLRAGTTCKPGAVANGHRIGPDRGRRSHTSTECVSDRGSVDSSALRGAAIRSPSRWLVALPPSSGEPEPATGART